MTKALEDTHQQPALSFGIVAVHRQPKQQRTHHADNHVHHGIIHPGIQNVLRVVVQNQVKHKLHDFPADGNDGCYPCGKDRCLPELLLADHDFSVLLRF